MLRTATGLLKWCRLRFAGIMGFAVMSRSCSMDPGDIGLTVRLRDAVGHAERKQDKRYDKRQLEKCCGDPRAAGSNGLHESASIHYCLLCQLI